VNESESAPLVLVSRTGGSHGSARATVTVQAGSAQAGQDFKTGTRQVTFGDGDTSPRLVEVPLLEDQETEPAETFTVSRGHARCAGLGAQRTAPVTIVDDDHGAPSSAPPSAPGGGATGRGWLEPGRRRHAADQPRPGLHRGARRRDGGQRRRERHRRALHHDRHARGLDRTFGTDGRVSTPVGNGQGQAVVIQPSGGIVATGWRGTAGIDGDLRSRATTRPATSIRPSAVPGSPSPT
jgi:hypothetical protein